MSAATRRLFKALDAANEAAALLMLLTTIVVVFLAAASRYVFANPIPWTEEVARFAFIWLAFVGISIAERHDAHFRIGFFVDQLPHRARRAVLVFDEIVVFAVLIMLLIEGIRFGRLGAQGLSAVLELPLHYIYMALPIAVGLTIVNRIRRTAAVYAASRRPDGGPDDHPKTVLS